MGSGIGRFGLATCFGVGNGEELSYVSTTLSNNH